MIETQVVVIGGGATGTGILRDLSMRGIAAILVEQDDLASGTSSRFHGLLHSGGRYVVSDPTSARECIEENMILRRIGRSCVEETEGYFVRTKEDDPAFEPTWLAACEACGIATEPVSIDEARRREPNLARDILAAYRVPDSAVDGFRLVHHNAMSANRYGGRCMTYCKVTGIDVRNGKVHGVSTMNIKTGEKKYIACEYIISAAGSWAGEVAQLAGLKINVAPDRGTLLAFNHRFTSRIVNRLRKPTDGDIFVPHGSIILFGTTSVPTSKPNDTRPTVAEVTFLLGIGKALFPAIHDYRILRAFAGTRPLYSPDAGTGRAATRNFVVIDHRLDGLEGMLSTTGGKFTTFRLMAEKACDHAAACLGVTTPCRTAEEPIIPEPEQGLLARAKKIFPTGGMELAVTRLGNALETAVTTAEKDPWKKLLLCECELVTLAEFETVAAEPASFSLGDIRRRTRLGMGTCQGSFCALRATGAMAENNALRTSTPREIFRQFVEERWHGIRPLLWGNQLREIELERGIYCATLNIDGSDGCTAHASKNGTAYIRPVRTAAMQTEPAAQPTLPPCGAHHDVIVVGAGFAGLVAAASAASRGKRTLVIANGAGALTIGGGGIDLLGYTRQGPVNGDPLAAMTSLPREHPYRLVGEEAILASLDFITALASQHGLPPLQAGSREHGNAWLPTAAGTMKPTWLTSSCMNPAVLVESSSFIVLGITGMKDFSPQMTALGLAAHPVFRGKRITHEQIPSPMATFSGSVRDTTALDIARFVDTAEGKKWLTEALASLGGDTEAVLIPSILGTKSRETFHAELEKTTGRRILELVCPPPSVTGLRIHSLLMEALSSLGVDIVEGATVSGALAGGAVCQSLVAATFGKKREYKASSFIIATGGLFSKGILTSSGRAFEPIFNLPIPTPASQDDWSLDTFFSRESHPFALMGVAANERLNPIDARGKVLFTNVHFVGRTLGGYDFALEKSGSGVALATGYYAGTLV